MSPPSLMTTNPTPPGPIALKVLAALSKLQRRNVIDLAAWRTGKARAEQDLTQPTGVPILKNHIARSRAKKVHSFINLAFSCIPMNAPRQLVTTIFPPFFVQIPM